MKLEELFGCMKMSDWEEKITCPHCNKKSVYEVYHELQGTEGIFNITCNSCDEDFEVDYYPVIEFKAREINV